MLRRLKCATAHKAFSDGRPTGERLYRFCVSKCQLKAEHSTGFSVMRGAGGCVPTESDYSQFHAWIDSRRRDSKTSSERRGVQVLLDCTATDFNELNWPFPALSFLLHLASRSAPPRISFSFGRPARGLHTQPINEFKLIRNTKIIKSIPNQFRISTA